MSNTVSGYLIRKTVQKISLRGYDYTNADDFKAKNLMIFVNKQFQDEQQRKRRADQQLDQEQDKHQKNQKQFLKEKIKQDIKHLKCRDDDKEFLEFYEQILQMISKYFFKDNFVVESEPGLNKQTHASSKKLGCDFQMKLKKIILDNFSDQQARKYFDVYRRAILKDKLNIIRPKIKDYDFVRKKLIGSNNYKSEKIDKKQDDYLMDQIQQQNNLKVGKILDIPEREFKYEAPDDEMQDFIKQRQEGKMTAMEQLNELIENQAEQENKEIIRIFKETKLDDFDPIGSAKNKFNMTAFKKKNEKQSEMLSKFQQDQKNNLINVLRDPAVQPEKFVRNKRKYRTPQNSVPVFNRLFQDNSQMSNISTNLGGSSTTRHLNSMTTRNTMGGAPQTSRSQVSQLRMEKVDEEIPEIDLTKPQSYMNYYKSQSVQQFNATKEDVPKRPQTREDVLKRKIIVLRKNGYLTEANRLNQVLKNEQSTQKIEDLKSKFNIFEEDFKENFKNDLKEVEDVFERDLENILQHEEIINQQMALEDPNFSEFKRRKNFRRRLVQFLVDKISNKSDIVSKYQDKLWSDKFRRQLIGE